MLEIVNLLKDSTVYKYQRAGVGAVADTLSGLAGECKIFNLLQLALLIRIVAEFRSLIRTAIPYIADWLKDSDTGVKVAGIDTLLKLSKHGK